MKVIGDNYGREVPVGDIEGGGTFEWGGNYYIRPIPAVCRTGILGINLDTGAYIGAAVHSDSTLMVRRVKMEARVL